MAESEKCFDLRYSDTQFKDEVVHAAGGETLTRCFSCGICTGCCPVSEVDNRFRPSSIIQMILMGKRDELLQSPIIWYCMQCFSCSFHCPQGVKFADIIRVLRHMAVEEGKVSGEVVERLAELELLVKKERIGLLDTFFEVLKKSNKGPEDIEQLWRMGISQVKEE